MSRGTVCFGGVEGLVLGATEPLEDCGGRKGVRRPRQGSRRGDPGRRRGAEYAMGGNLGDAEVTGPKGGSIP